MAYCAKCGTLVPEGAAACPSCGQAQATASSGSTASTGMASNVAAALAYIWLIAILWLVLEPYNKDRFIRFHSFQALAFGVSWFVLWWVVAFLPLINLLLFPLLGLAGFLLWLFLLYKAYNNEWFKLPVIGDWAMQQAGPAK